MKKTFPGGRHLDAGKHLTKNKAIVAAALPAQVVLPLNQHTGSICEPLVKAGDEVKTGMKIGASDKLISGAVHASVSGRVAKITDYKHPVLGRCAAVIIDTAAGDDRTEFMPRRGDPAALSRDEILPVIREAGIVGLGGAAFPAHVKLNPPKSVDTLIINAAECEPFLTCDYRLMLEQPEDIISGVLLLRKVLNVSQVFIGIEDDNPEAAKALREVIAGKGVPIEVSLLSAKYPQGAEKQLIQAITGREVPAGKLPFEAGAVVNNVATAFAVFEAVYKGKPLYERVVTVTGSCLRAPANIRVRLGTRFSELIRFCGGTTRPAAKVIMGGPMMGIAQPDDDAPVIKGTSGILVLSPEEVREYVEGPCMRCGRCVEACPVRMLPYALSLCGEAKRFDLAGAYNPLDCIECGLCTYVCPARRRILEYIRLIKAVVR